MNKLTLLAALIISLVVSLFVGVPKALALEAPRIWAQSGPRRGQVTVFWDRVAGANDYSIVYGTAPGQYQYGAISLNDGTAYTVASLTPGQRYFFALSAQNGGDTSGFSNEVSAIAARGTVSRHGIVSVKSNPNARPTVTSQGTMWAPRTSLRTPDETTGRRGTGLFNLRAIPGPKRGEVSLFWNADSTADGFAVRYGVQPGQYIYGLSGLTSDARAITIKALVPHQRYCFSLVATGGPASSYFGAEVCEYAR